MQARGIAKSFQDTSRCNRYQLRHPFVKRLEITMKPAQVNCGKGSGDNPGKERREVRRASPRGDTDHSPVF